MLQFIAKCALAIQTGFLLGGCGSLPVDILDARNEAQEAQFAEAEADSMADRMEHFWGCYRKVELREPTDNQARRGCAACAEAYDVPMVGMCVGEGGGTSSGN